MRHIVLAFFVLCSSAIFAQNATINEDLIPEGRMEQHLDFMADKTPYPAKPRNQWAIGLNLGIPNIAGDVQTRPIGGQAFSWGAGLNVRKALGYATSLRLGYNYMTAHGQNSGRQAVGRNDALLGLGYDNPGLGDLGDPYNSFVHNYENTAHNVTLDMLLNLNNLKFHSGENKVAVYLSGGGGLYMYQTMYNALNGAAIYDWNSVVDNVDFSGAKDQRDAVEAELDDDYETPGEFDEDRWHFGDAPDPMNARLQMSVGAGVQFKLGKSVSLDIEHRTTVPFDDLLDGQRWEFGGRTFTPSNDLVHYTSIGVSIHVGGNSAAPSWFVNPMDYVYSELKEIQPPDMSDSDGDGVLDLLDQEPETPEGFPVNARGVTLDSDKDGCPDGEDPEPFSSPAYPIVDCQNNMPATLTPDAIEKLIDDKMRPMIASAGSNWFLPNIYFDLNRDKIRPDAYDELEYVATVMQKYKGLQVEVIGHTDTRASEEYNIDLSRRRAENAIEHLATRYGIDKSRFIMKYLGKSSVLYSDARAESQHQVNRRVEFRAVLSEN